MKSDVCETYCPYYKPAKDEGLACLGYLVIERLIGKGTSIPGGKRERTLDPAVSESLFKNMCIRCPFYDDDCDFALVSGSNTSASSTSPGVVNGQQFSGQVHLPSPCGGFILLGYLLEEKIINIDDIRKLI